MKMKIVLALFVAVAFTFCCTVSWAQNAPEVLKVTGDPKILKRGADKWVSCAVSMAVGNGDRIRTMKDESLEIGFIDLRKNIVKIGGDSDVVIMSGQNPYSIDMFAGEVMALLMSLPEDSTFEVKTPTGVSGARGTGWRSETDGQRSSFEAYDNTIYVKGIERDGSVMEEELLVDMGYKTVVGKFERPERVEKLTDREMERWNAWRDSVKDREAKESQEPGPGGPVSTTEKMAGSPSAATDTRLDKTERTAEGRDKLDRISREETRSIEALESRKQDISESRDAERIAERQAEQPASSGRTSQEERRGITPR